MRHMPWSSTGTRGTRIFRLLCLMLATSFVLQVGVAAAEPVVEAASAPATEMKAVDIMDGQALLMTDGVIGKFRHFSLGAPPRLVVDIYDVKPGNVDSSYTLEGAFRRLRTGVFPDRTRFVFDSATQRLPEYRVSSTGQLIQVAWNDVPVAGEIVAASPQGAPVTVEAIDFNVENGKSVLTVTLSGATRVYGPEAEGDLVRFGLRNALISRALRRFVDPSAFPSAIRMITPYTVSVDGAQDVRFAVELKDVVPYRLEQDGNKVRFIVEDGPFAEPVPVALETHLVPVPTPTRPRTEVVDRPVAVDRRVSPDVPVAMVRRPDPRVFETAMPEPVYSGQRISLIFDDANIRNILQLIAEVSDLNIIAGDGVTGTITLRLVDVPWDQALDLIMDIQGLGMLRDGNVVRIMPKEQIRRMQQEQFAASRALERMEDLVTEVMTVNYTDVGSVATRSRQRLTERGSIIEDVRDKKLIVSDVPSVVADIRNLVTLLDSPERQVLIEARIVEARSTFSRELGINWGITYDNNPGGVSSTVGETGLGGSFALNPAAVAAGSAGLASGFTFGRAGLDKLVIDTRIAALETSGHGRIVSSPRITTLNGQEAEISQGTEIPYFTTSDQGTRTEFKRAELSLKVTPEINPDGSIFLEIEARNDSRGADVPTGLGTAPAIDTKRAETKLLVHDGETTVIGGIFIEDQSESEAGVPWLKNIPGLGNLFKSRSTDNSRRELLIFITPRILD